MQYPAFLGVIIINTNIICGAINITIIVILWGQQLRLDVYKRVCSRTEIFELPEQHYAGGQSDFFGEPLDVYIAIRGEAEVDDALQREVG